MKKLLISLVALAAMAITANAQWYVGGNVGLSATASSSASVNWNISPDGGYILNETMLVGAAINLGGAGSSDGLGSSNFTFSFQPYYRWKFWGINSLNFWLEGRISIGSYTATSKSEYNEAKHKSTFTRGTWGLAVAPIISYDIDSHWSILTKIASIGVAGYGKGDYKIDGDYTYTINGGTYFSFMAINGPSIGVCYTF